MRDLLASATFWAALTAIFTLAAVIAASVYAWLTYLLVRAGRTPLVVPEWQNAEIDDLVGDLAILANAGSGAALSLCLADSEGHVLRFFGVLRAGSKVTLPGNVGIERLPTVSFFLWYQDMTGSWYSTKFVPSGGGFQTKFSTAKASSVPEEVRKRAQAMSPWDAVVAANEQDDDE